MEAKDLLIHQGFSCKTHQQSFLNTERACQYLNSMGLDSKVGQSSTSSDSCRKDFEHMMLSQWSRERDPIHPREKEEILGYLCHFGLISLKGNLVTFELESL